ncbi:MAG: hypothetical protein ACK4ZU_04065 [Allorhizobium sp.]
MKNLSRPNPDDYQQGVCDGYDGGCHVCAESYLDDLREYRAEWVTRRDAAGPAGFHKDSAYEAEFEIQWADREIAAATPRSIVTAVAAERPKFASVVTTEVHDDGSVTVIETWRRA